MKAVLNILNVKMDIICNLNPTNSSKLIHAKPRYANCSPSISVQAVKILKPNVA